MTVTGTHSADKSPGAIRVVMSGYGPKLVKADITISNNEIYGAYRRGIMWAVVGWWVLHTASS